MASAWSFPPPVWAPLREEGIWFGFHWAIEWLPVGLPGPELKLSSVHFCRHPEFCIVVLFHSLDAQPNVFLTWPRGREASGLSQSPLQTFSRAVALSCAVTGGAETTVFRAAARLTEPCSLPPPPPPPPTPTLEILIPAAPPATMASCSCCLRDITTNWSTSQVETPQTEAQALGLLN